MNLSAVVWFNDSKYEIQELVRRGSLDNIDFAEVAEYSQVIEQLDNNENARIVIATLDPQNIQVLYQIQHMREYYPKVTLLAFFNAMDFDMLCTGISLATAKYSQNEREFKRAEMPSSPPLSARETHPVDLFSIADNQITGKKRLCHLTPRQQDVLHCLMLGKSNKQIARELNLSEGTVKIHCMAIFRELGVVNRTQAAMLAEQLFPQPHDTDFAKVYA